MEKLFCAIENLPNFVNIWTLWHAYSFNGPKSRHTSTTSIVGAVATFWEGLVYGFQLL